MEKTFIVGASRKIKTIAGDKKGKEKMTVYVTSFLGNMVNYKDKSHEKVNGSIMVAISPLPFGRGLEQVS